MTVAHTRSLIIKGGEGGGELSLDSLDSATRDKGGLSLLSSLLLGEEGGGDKLLLLLLSLLIVG